MSAAHISRGAPPYALPAAGSWPISIDVGTAYSGFYPLAAIVHTVYHASSAVMSALTAVCVAQSTAGRVLQRIAALRSVHLAASLQQAAPAEATSEATDPPAPLLASDQLRQRPAALDRPLAGTVAGAGPECSWHSEAAPEGELQSLLRDLAQPLADTCASYDNLDTDSNSLATDSNSARTSGFPSSFSTAITATTANNNSNSAPEHATWSTHAHGALSPGATSATLASNDLRQPTYNALGRDSNTSTHEPLCAALASTQHDVSEAHAAPALRGATA